MTASRALLAVAGVALGASLFLSWFGGVSGWEHWAWADVPLAFLAAALLAAAALPDLAPLRLAVAVLCGLGIAVVLGHGFEPDGGIAKILAGPYVALSGLALGVVAALAAWPRRAGAVLIVGAAAGLVASLFWHWGSGRDLIVVFGALDRFNEFEPTGWERWRVLDVAFVALAVALLGVASGRAPRLLLPLCVVGCAAAGACVVVAVLTRTGFWVDEGAGVGAPSGAVAALLALAAALAGLALLRPRGRAARAG